MEFWAALHYYLVLVAYDTMTNLTDWNYTKLQNYKYKLNLNDNLNEEQIDYLLNQTKGQTLLESTAKIVIDEQNLDVSLTVLENNDYIKLAQDLSNFKSLKEGIALSKKIADKLDLKVGDIIKWKGNLDHQEYQSKISLIIRTPNIQGITIMKEEYLQTGHQYYPTAIIGSKKSRLLDQSNKYFFDSVSAGLIRKLLHVLLEAMILIIIILVLGAIILGGVILYNLGVLSYLERYYEFSTLKVLGFKDTRDSKNLGSTKYMVINDRNFIRFACRIFID